MATDTPTTNPSVNVLFKEHPLNDRTLDRAVLCNMHEWHKARGELRAAYASRDLASEEGRTGPDSEYERASEHLTVCLENMHKAQDDLLVEWPSTLSGIRNLLEIAAEIMAYRKIDREGLFGTGPVLDILAVAIEGVAGVQNKLHYNHQ